MRIVVDKSSQTATVYNNDQLVRTFPVCTGTPGAFGETDNGTFYIYLKYAVQDMRGYNEDGSKYLSPGVSGSATSTAARASTRRTGTTTASRSAIRRTTAPTAA